MSRCPPPMILHLDRPCCASFGHDFKMYYPNTDTHFLLLTHIHSRSEMKIWISQTKLTEIVQQEFLGFWLHRGMLCNQSPLKLNMDAIYTSIKYCYTKIHTELAEIVKVKQKIELKYLCSAKPKIISRQVRDSVPPSVRLFVTFLHKP